MFDSFHSCVTTVSLAECTRPCLDIKEQGCFKLLSDLHTNVMNDGVRAPFSNLHYILLNNNKKRLVN